MNKHLILSFFFLAIISLSAGIEQDLNQSFDLNDTIQEFDSGVELVDYSFSGNRSEFVFRSPTVNRIEMYDVNGFTERGLEEIPINQYSLKSGYTRIEMDLTSKRGDKTVFIRQRDSGMVVSNSRTSELIGQPEHQRGFIFGMFGSGIAVITVIFGKRRWKQYKIDNGGVQIY